MIVLLLVLSHPAAVWTFDYCSLNCQHPVTRVHTMCGDEFPRGGGSACGAWKLGLSKADKRALLDRHNEARQKIASGAEGRYPTAANMMVMTWHGECAAIAQRWMDQCTMANGVHDNCDATRDGPAGQNLFWGGNMVDDDTAVVDRSLHGWYDQEAPLYADAGYTLHKYHFDMNSAHFTQVVWATSSGLGCGLRKKAAASGGSADYSLACNYFPAGNFIGAPVYLEGPPCSACPQGTTCSSRYPALCARPGDDDAEIPDDEAGGGEGGVVTRPAPILLIVHSLVFISIRYAKSS